MNTELVSKVFPNASVERFDEINGLPFSALNELKANLAIRIIAIGHTFGQFINNQYYFLIEVDKHTIYGRICDADKDSGYDMYCVIHDIRPLENEYVERSTRIIYETFNNQNYPRYNENQN